MQGIATNAVRDLFDTVWQAIRFSHNEIVVSFSILRQVVRMFPGFSSVPASFAPHSGGAKKMSGLNKFGSVMNRYWKVPER
ncbi:hypothetical protein GH722_14825 [Alphaproteobacteria bacterium HT1-32]|nr:hypothetical protein [Alphaproteobacteria bacterium HT1-32]